MREWEDGALLRVPSGLCCPLCADLLQDPQVAGDGYSYCAGCIAAWLQQHARRAANRRRTGQHLDAAGQEIPLPLRSPVTDEPLSPGLRPNHALRLVAESCRAAPAPREKGQQVQEGLRGVGAAHGALGPGRARPAGPVRAYREPGAETRGASPPGAAQQRLDGSALHPQRLRAC